MKAEIERKFLVTGEITGTATAFAADRRELRQGYILSSNPEIRIRQDDNNFLLTVKNSDGVTRGEHEEEISRQMFDALRPACGERIIEKSRYLVEIDGRLVEVDIYQGRLKGLVIAEVEFASIDESMKFDVSSLTRILGDVQEVTEDKRYKNAMLAISGIPAS